MHATASSLSVLENFTNFDVEKEYSPSRCSKRAIDNDPDDLVNTFVDIHRKETIHVRNEYRSRLDVRYGDSKRESMDIYFKDKEMDTPIFVYVHGGYWVALDKSDSGICVAPLVERGYRVVVMDYDLCPTVTLEELVKQMRKFLKVLLDYSAATNAKQISLCGHSAGAHLIATFLQSECLELPHAHLIKKMFLISGIYDLSELWKVQAANPGNVLSLNERKAAALSPILYRLPNSAENIQIHVITAEYDSRTFRRQSREFFTKLESNDIPAFHPVFPEYDHFNIIEELRFDNSLITTYLLTALGLNKLKGRDY